MIRVWVPTYNFLISGSQPNLKISDLANISAGLNSHATTDKHEPAHFGNKLESTNTVAWRIES